MDLIQKSRISEHQNIRTLFLPSKWNSLFHNVNSSFLSSTFPILSLSSKVSNRFFFLKHFSNHITSQLKTLEETSLFEIWGTLGCILPINLSNVIFQLYGPQILLPLWISFLHLKILSFLSPHSYMSKYYQFNVISWPIINISLEPTLPGTVLIPLKGYPRIPPDSSRPCLHPPTATKIPESMFHAWMHCRTQRNAQYSTRVNNDPNGSTYTQGYLQSFELATQPSFQSHH